MGFDFQAAYDELNPADDDHRFYAALAATLGARRVLDLGCGTGTLAHLLSRAGHAVVGIDPDPEMLRVARAKGDAGIDWRLGRSDVADTGSVDLAVMSGHVAQVFTSDAAWDAVLADLHRALVPGGTLAFESRNPSARGWDHWTRDQTLRTVGGTELWHETVDVSLPLVAYDTVTRDLGTGAEARHRDVLAFRDLLALRGSLERAGFDVTAAYGDWSKLPVMDAAAEIVVIARR